MTWEPQFDDALNQNNSQAHNYEQVPGECVTEHSSDDSRQHPSLDRDKTKKEFGQASEKRLDLAYSFFYLIQERGTARESLPGVLLLCVSGPEVPGRRECGACRKGASIAEAAGRASSRDKPVDSMLFRF